MLFVAVLPQGTPAKNLTTEPPPATGPYQIVNVERGKGWSYVRNPQWAKANGAAIPEVPSGHVDKIDISLVRNGATQVNEIERDKTDWMQTLVPADLYSKVKDKYEGTQFRVEHAINIYYFWMNTTRPPFDDVKVRQAVNYAVDRAALERIYAGSLSGDAPDPARRHARPRSVRPLPARHGESEEAVRGSQPVRPRASPSGPTTKARTTKPAPTTQARSKNSASTRS